MSSVQQPQERRQRLQRLDDCLYLLESAHEAGMTMVNGRIEAAVRERVPTIIEGMTIADAIEEVFRIQEPLMALPEPERPGTERRLRRRRPVDVSLILDSSR